MNKSKPYEKMKFYQDICEIRRFIHKVIERFIKDNLRLVSQMRDSARSAKQDIREGYRKGSLGEYIHSIKISQGSLEELSGDIEDCRDDGLISEDEFKKFIKLYRSADYMSTKYLESMYEIERKGTWKILGESRRKT